MSLDNYWYGRDTRQWRADGLDANGLVPSTVTVLSTSNTGSVSFVSGANDVEAIITVSVNSARIRLDFVTTPPTTYGTGLLVPVDGILRVPIRPDSAFAVVALGTSASASTVFVQFLSAV